MPISSHVANEKILVVGAGPVGLVSALLLVSKGIDVTIIDKGNGPSGLSKATGLWPAAFDVFKEIGVADELIRCGIKIQKSHFMDDQGYELMSIGHRETDGVITNLLSISQAKTEEILADKLRKMGIKIHYRTSLVDIEIKKIDGIGNKPKVFLEGKSADALNKEEFDLVFACDGAKSTVVQKTLGPEGITKEKDPNTFFVADVLLNWPEHADNETYAHLTTKGLRFFIPLPTDDNNKSPKKQLYRVTGICPNQNASGHTLPPTTEELQDLLKEQGIALSPEDILQSPQAFPVYYKQVKSYHFPCDDNAGNPVVLFLGDAAHSHSPAGAQGITTGVMDALAAVKIVSEGKDLKQYHQERYLWGEKAITLSRQATYFAGLQSYLAIARNRALFFLSYVPGATEFIRQRIEQRATEFN